MNLVDTDQLFGKKKLVDLWGYFLYSTNEIPTEKSMSL
jgi:hypothetical protein